MARPLTDRMVKQAKPGVLIDGRGLRLRVSINPATGVVRKSWILRTTVKDGAIRELGLGSAADVTLAQVREAARRARLLARSGVDPLQARNAERAARAAERARAATFRECADAYVAAHAPGWRNAKHRQQWKNTLQAYAFPVFGHLPVQAIDVDLVMQALTPIWNTKTETASRVRQRIEQVLHWANARGLRQGENPAQWRGRLDKLLPPRAKVQRVRHHPALPYPALPEFLAELRACAGESGRALEFAILTAARTGEVLGARWSEFDLNAGVWTIPAERMKAGRTHRVPLAPHSLSILRAAGSEYSALSYVFSGARPERPLSNMALAMTLRRMKRDTLTVHGFRSTFRDWAAERTSFAREVAEAALAHAIGDKVEAAYRRGDLFEKRRKLMVAWGKYCAAQL